MADPAASDLAAAVYAATRRVIHDLRQPLAAMQMWADLLGEAQAGRASEKEERYLAKIRAEVKRMAALLAEASKPAAGAATDPGVGAASCDAATKTAEEGAPLAGVSIVVVEDDEVTAEALQLALESEGAAVAVANTFEAGLALLRARCPDAVLSDLRMADGDGFAVAAEVRRLDQASGRRTLALAVTGFDNHETRVAARAAGFDDVITKPFSIAALIETIRRRVAHAG